MWVDEDPSIFGYVIKYLTNCGQPGAVQLLPSDHKEREELRWELALRVEFGGRKLTFVLPYFCSTPHSG